MTASTLSNSRELVIRSMKKKVVLRMRYLSIILAFVAFAFGFVKPASGKGNKPSKIAPVNKDWRVYLTPDQIEASHDNAHKIPGLIKVDAREEAKKDGDKNDQKEFKGWPEDSDGQSYIEFEIAEAKKHNLLIALDVRGQGEPIPLTLAVAKKRGSKKWKKIAAIISQKPADYRRKGNRDVRLIWPRGKYTVARLIFGAEGEELGSIRGIRIYKLDRKKRNDYWLFTGSGIMTRAVDPTDMSRVMRETFKDYDPYVVNEAGGDWDVTRLWKKMPEILKRHPHSRYVCIHIGGVNVTQSRPFPRGSKNMQQRIEAVLQMIKKAGKIPILSRLSYRHYRKKGGQEAVPPESNGSGPYVFKIYDPLIRKYCRPFYDNKARRGHVDLYGYFRDHKRHLEDGGVMPNDRGYEGFRKIWLNRAAAIVYTGKIREERAGEKKKEPGKPSGPPAKQS
jgi:hypothetical protein